MRKISLSCKRDTWQWPKFCRKQAFEQISKEYLYTTPRLHLFSRVGLQRDSLLYANIVTYMVTWQRSVPYQRKGENGSRSRFQQSRWTHLLPSSLTPPAQTLNIATTQAQELVVSCEDKQPSPPSPQATNSSMPALFPLPFLPQFIFLGSKQYCYCFF
jgi:hypothetical protein